MSKVPLGQKSVEESAVHENGQLLHQGQLLHDGQLQEWGSFSIELV